MSRSTSLSNMCPIISCLLVRAQGDGPIFSRFLVAGLERSPFVGGCVFAWGGGWGRPSESPQKRGAFHRYPLPDFAPDLTFRTRHDRTTTTPAALTITKGKARVSFSGRMSSTATASTRGHA